MKTVTLVSPADGGNYVPAAPGISTRYANVYAVENVPDEMSANEVAKRRSLTTDVRPGWVDRKVIDFADLSDGITNRILANR
jgi:hypothetical protein